MDILYNKKQETLLSKSSMQQLILPAEVHAITHQRGKRCGYLKEIDSLQQTKMQSDRTNRI